jgi:hypothetical protein
MRIPMANSDLVALVDDEDCERLMEFRWFATEGRRGAFYARRQWTLRNPDGTFQHFIREMQRDVLDPTMTALRSQVAGHKNHNTMDNQRHNLRWLDHRGSMLNRRLFVNNSTGYRGVYWKSGCRRFQAQLMSHGTRYNGGFFLTAEEAARAYNQLAIQHHGDLAQLNAIPEEIR